MTTLEHIRNGKIERLIEHFGRTLAEDKIDGTSWDCKVIDTLRSLQTPLYPAKKGPVG